MQWEGGRGEAEENSTRPDRRGEHKMEVHAERIGIENASCVELR